MVSKQAEADVPLERLLSKLAVYKEPWIPQTESHNCIFLHEQGFGCTLHPSNPTVPDVIEDGAMLGRAEWPFECRTFPFYWDGQEVTVSPGCLHFHDFLQRVMEEDEEAVQAVTTLQELLPGLTPPDLVEMFKKRHAQHPVRVVLKKQVNEDADGQFHA